MNAFVQVHGATGYAAGSWVERAWRDARLLRIGAGTDEVMREVISRTEPVRAVGGSKPSGRPSQLPRYGLFTEEHEALRDVVRTWVDRRIRPNTEVWEREGDFPLREILGQAGGMGLLGAKYEEAYGGTGPDLVADAVITEELAGCGSGGVAAALGAHRA
jgi:alkylation response protein AidB-like acyl-CoA dehydrogenase